MRKDISEDRRRLCGPWRETPALGGTSFIALVRRGLPLGKERPLVTQEKLPSPLLPQFVLASPAPRQLSYFHLRKVVPDWEIWSLQAPEREMFSFRSANCWLNLRSVSHPPCDDSISSLAASLRGVSIHGDGTCSVSLLAETQPVFSWQQIALSSSCPFSIIVFSFFSFLLSPC